MPLSLQSRRVGEVVVLTGSGRLVEGSESTALRQQFDSLLPDDCHIVLNLSGVDFIDSAGLGLLVRLLSRTRAAQGDLKLSAVPSRLAEVLRITRLGAVFDSYESDAEAIAAFYERARSDGAVDRFDTDILCVEQSADVLAYVCGMLKQAGYGVIPSSNLADALVLLRASRPSMVVIGSALRASRDTWAADTFNRLAGSVSVLELPADFSQRDAGDAGERFLEQVRAAIGDRA